MTEDLLMQLMGGLKKHLDSKKAFVANPARFAEVENAIKIASSLFADATVYVADDPLDLGALIVRIEGTDITVSGNQEIQLFVELISNADNFEIYPISEDRLRFAMVFGRALRTK